MSDAVDTIAGRVRDFVLERFPAADPGVADDASLLDSGAVDSVGILDIVMFVEDEFDVEISDDDLLAENFESIAAVARTVFDRLPSTGS